jgi:hypothetical protein
VQEGNSMDKVSAEKLSILMIQLNQKMNESIDFVKHHDKEGLFKDYHKIAGEVMGTLYVDIERKLWEEFPELKPKQMDGPYEIDPTIYEPRFYLGNNNNT